MLLMDASALLSALYREMHQKEIGAETLLCLRTWRCKRTLSFSPIIVFIAVDATILLNNHILWTYCTMDVSAPLSNPRCSLIRGNASEGAETLLDIYVDTL